MFAEALRKHAWASVLIVGHLLGIDLVDSRFELFNNGSGVELSNHHGFKLMQTSYICNSHVDPGLIPGFISYLHLCKRN